MPDFKFTAISPMGIPEEFTGYDSFEEAIKGQERLEAKGYEDFSTPTEEVNNG